MHLLASVFQRAPAKHGGSGVPGRVGCLLHTASVMASRVAVSESGSRASRPGCPAPTTCLLLKHRWQQGPQHVLGARFPSVSTGNRRDLPPPAPVYTSVPRDPDDLCEAACFLCFNKGRALTDLKYVHPAATKAVRRGSLSSRGNDAQALAEPAKSAANPNSWVPQNYKIPSLVSQH